MDEYALESYRRAADATDSGHFAREILPVPIRYVNLGDTFAESGTPDELLEKYGLTAGRIAEAAKAAVAAKKR